MMQMSLFSVPQPKKFILTSFDEVKKRIQEEDKEKHLKELKRYWNEIEKCAEYIVSLVFASKELSKEQLKIKKIISNDVEYLKKIGMNLSEIKIDFTSWLYVKIFLCAKNVTIWLSLVKKRKFVSLQVRVAWFFKNFVRDEYKKFYNRNVFFEDNKTPRAATREVFSTFESHTPLEEVDYV